MRTRDTYFLPRLIQKPINADKGHLLLAPFNTDKGHLFLASLNTDTY